MDAAWDGIANAGLRPVLGSRLANQLDDTLHGRFNLPPGGQFGGWHIYLDKDLRTLLGNRVRGKFRNRYCGRAGSRAAAGTSGAAIDAAGAALARTQGPIRPSGVPTPSASGSSSCRGCCRRRSGTRTGRAASSR